MHQEAVSIVTLDLETDSHAVPFDQARHAIQAMQRNTHERVMFTMLTLTGCRISELDLMRPDRLLGEYLYWKLGKKQQRPRKERLPAWYLEELREYRKLNKTDDVHLFGISSETFRRYFNRDVRPRLGPSWSAQRPIPLSDGSWRLEYVLQLKGLRKSFQTLLFYKLWAELRDSGLAVDMTSKRMEHSSQKITARHYVENFRALNIQQIGHLTPDEALKHAHQRNLFDF